jgi:hypothetical protein
VLNVGCAVKARARAAVSVTQVSVAPRTRTDSGSTRRRVPWARRRVLHGLALLGIAVLWFGASLPWGLPVWHILPFAAPSALVGLATGWMAHAATRKTWTWGASGRSAAVGALVLSPLLVFYVGIEGNLRPERLTAGFVRAAWMALGVGAAWSCALWLRRARSQRAARAKAGATRAS